MIDKKMAVFIAAIVVIISLLAGCSGDVTDKVYNNNNRIASTSDSFGLDKSDEKIESGVYSGKLKLSGAGTIWKYESDSDIDLKVPYTLSVKSGKAKIVFISPDNKVTNLVENTNKSSMKKSATLTIPIKKGTNRIKLVGYKKADIDIEIHIDKGEFEKISFDM